MHLLSQISIIPNIWQLIPFMKFAMVPIYPICTNPAVSTDPESATASLTWSAQLVVLHWLNTSAVCPLELNCPLKFCPSSWKKGAFSPALWWRHALSVSEVTQHAATSLFLCSKMQHKYTAALISNGSYANGRVIFPSPHLAQHAFISPNTLKCGGKKREKNPTAGFTFCGNSRRHKQAYRCNMQLNVLQQVSSKTRRKTTGWVQTIIIRNQTSEIKLCRCHSCVLPPSFRNLKL